jgi:hypothetical protein
MTPVGEREADGARTTEKRSASSAETRGRFLRIREIDGDHGASSARCNRSFFFSGRNSKEGLAERGIFEPDRPLCPHERVTRRCSGAAPHDHRVWDPINPVSRRSATIRCLGQDDKSE